MKNFQSLREGFDYKKECPICKSFIFPSDRSEFRQNNDRLVLQYSSEDYNYTIDSNSGKIINRFYIENENILKFSNREIIYSGSSFECQSITPCFYFVLGYSIDIGDRMGIESVFINSEEFNFRDETSQYLIRNVYPCQQTEISKNNSFVTKIPLVEFNYDNPQKTFDKIKKILVFS